MGYCTPKWGTDGNPDLYYTLLKRIHRCQYWVNFIFSSMYNERPLDDLCFTYWKKIRPIQKCQQYRMQLRIYNITNSIIHREHYDTIKTKYVYLLKLENIFFSLIQFYYYPREMMMMMMIHKNIFIIFHVFLTCRKSLPCNFYERMI